MTAWTHAEDDLLRSEWIAHLSIPLAAKAFPTRTTDAVCKRAKRMGILVGEFVSDPSMQGEVWRDIPEWEVYQASNMGRIRRKGGTTHRHSAKIRNPKLSRHGYLCVLLSKNSKKQWMSVHVAVLKAFRGLPPIDKPQGAHNDGDRLNCVLENLRWASCKENAADRVLHKKQVCGEGHLFRKLDRAQVNIVRQMARTGAPTRSIQVALGVNISLEALRKIINGKTWQRDHDFGPGPKHA
jgi:hypothetical protein